MPYLTINGTEIQVARNASSRATEIIGDGSRRAFNGALLTSIRARKSRLSITTPPLEYSEAEAWETVLEGATLTVSGGILDGAVKTMRAEEVDIDYRAIGKTSNRAVLSFSLREI